MVRMRNVITEETGKAVGRNGHSGIGGGRSWIGLRIQFGLPDIYWGALWAAVCGMVATGLPELDATTGIKLVLVLLLADPLISNLCYLLFDLDWTAGDSTCGSEAGSATYVCSLPYARSGSLGYRMGRRLDQARRWWTDIGRQRLGWMLSGVVFGCGAMLVLGSVVGPGVTLLVIFSFGAIGIGLLVRPYSLDVAVSLRALVEAGVPWLAGYLVLMPLSPTALLMAFCFSLIYGASLHLSLRGMGKAVWLIPLSLMGLLGLLIHARSSLSIALLGLILVFPIWLSWYSLKKQRSTARYLSEARPSVMVAMFLSALSLGVT